MKKLFLISLFACHTFCIADVFKYIDADGNITYTNKAIPGGKKIVLPDISTVSTISESSNITKSSHSNNDTVKNTIGSGNAPSGNRKTILEEELKKEKDLLSDAIKTLEEQKLIRNGNEKNFAKKIERLRSFEEAVNQHNNNIKALEIELNK